MNAGNIGKEKKIGIAGTEKGATAKISGSFYFSRKEGRKRDDGIRQKIQ